MTASVSIAGAPARVPGSFAAALADAVRAAAATPAQRLRRGPLRPGWSLAYESRVALLRAACRYVFTTGDAAAARRMVAWGTLGTPPARGVTTWRAPLGGVRAEWTAPDGAARGGDGPVVLCLHGGGYLVGSPGTYRWLASRLAAEARCRVVTPAYRLAPEHPYPAALDDAVAAWDGLLAAGVPPGRVVLVGDSAGGGLAVALLLRLRDEGRPLPAGAALQSPWTDLTGSSESLVTNDGLDYLEGWYLPRVARRYAGTADLRHPYLSPVFADLSGLPPLLVQVGAAEVLRDDGGRLAAAARTAGVPARLEVWPAEVHVWHQLVDWHEPARRARAGIVAFVRERT